MNTTAVKIVIDTNILIAIIGRQSPFRWMFDCLIQGRIIACVSTEILLEYREILEQKNGVEVADNVINFLTVNPHTEKVDVYYDFGLIRQDIDDNKYVNCAIASNALCIVSNDRHFQVLKTIGFPKVGLFTLLEFEKTYKEQLME